jgi:hypothetical protein
MSAFSTRSSPKAEPQSTVPVRSPRTSMILAELARQRRYERRRRRLKRQWRRWYALRREFPIPPLVAGLPWRFAQHPQGPVVPEAEFAPLDLPSLGPTADPLASGDI